MKMPEEDYQGNELRLSRTFQARSAQTRLLVGIARAQWWSVMGSVLFASGIVLVVIAYATISVIPVVPTANIGALPTVTDEAYALGILVAAVGLIITFYGRYRIERLSLGVAG